MADFTIDAYLAHNFSVGAYIVGDRWRHDLTNDHFGDLSSLQVVTEQYYGPYPPGTPLHYVLDWLVNRIVALESVEKGYGNFGIQAYVLAYGDVIDLGGTSLGIFSIDSVKWMYRGGMNFTIDAADFVHAFSMDAKIRFQGELYIEAVVV
jgi:hypothetical protein